MTEERRESIRQANRDLLRLDALAVAAAPHSRSAVPAKPRKMRPAKRLASRR
jgi:hypothetical protein